MRALAVKSSAVSEIDTHTSIAAAEAACSSSRRQQRPRFSCGRSKKPVSSWRLPVRVVVNSGHDQLLFVPVSAD
jgi:hypothetical protein